MISRFLFHMGDRYVSKWIVLAVDILIVCVAFVLSYFIRFNLSFNFDIGKLLIQIPVVALVFTDSLIT